MRLMSDPTTSWSAPFAVYQFAIHSLPRPPGAGTARALKGLMRSPTLQTVALNFATRGGRSQADLQPRDGEGFTFQPKPRTPLPPSGATHAPRGRGPLCPRGALGPPHPQDPARTAPLPPSAHHTQPPKPRRNHWIVVKSLALFFLFFSVYWAPVV